jgi:hypothetical protein
MPDVVGHGSTPAASAAPPTVGELIRDELKGKNTALARYDAIVWKIRSGYIAILYGMLTFMAKEGLKEKLVRPDGFFLVFGFSLLGCLLDYGFVRSKLKVVDAINDLSDEALRLAVGEPVNPERLRGLLHIAGEVEQESEACRFVARLQLSPAPVFHHADCCRSARDQVRLIALTSSV